MTIPLAGFEFRVSHTIAVPSREHEANILLPSCGCAHTQDTWCRCAGRYVCSEVSDSASQTLMLQISNYRSSSFYTSKLCIIQWQITDKTKEKHITVMHHITKFHSMTDHIYDSGENFWKLQINSLGRKINCKSKSSIWMKPPCSGNRDA